MISSFLDTLAILDFKVTITNTDRSFFFNGE